MKAAVLTPSGISLQAIPVPLCQSNEILVKVRASSLNRADLYLLDGRYHGDAGGAGTVLGLEWAGDVVQAGSAVGTFKVGDRVMCSGMGGFAEYAVTDWRRAFPIPSEQVSYEEAACLCIALRTAYTALVTTARVRAGEFVLVQGASSATGLMTMQVAKELGAGLVIGTSTNSVRRERLRDFGASLTLDSRDPDWVTRVLHQTNGAGVSVLVDFLAGPMINHNMRATCVGGRIVNVGRMAGENGHFDFDLHSLRRIEYLGTTFRTRSAQQVGEIAEGVFRDLWPSVRAGRLSLPIAQVWPLERLGEAMEMMRQNRHFGKIILTQETT